MSAAEPRKANAEPSEDQVPTDSREEAVLPEAPQAASPGDAAPAAAEAAAPPSEVPEAEIAALKDQLLRAVAETENVRRRMQRDQEETAKYAITGFARDLVNVLENLQRATQSIPPEAREQNPMLKSLAEGVDMTMKELLSAFERNGIVRIDPIGHKFDHNLHQAVVQIEHSKAEAGTVVQVLQAGYMIHDRLLRPAMVGVAKASDAPKNIDTQA